MFRTFFRLAVATAATAVIAAVTFISSVKIAEEIEKSLEGNDDSKNDDAAEAEEVKEEEAPAGPEQPAEEAAEEAEQPAEEACPAQEEEKTEEE